MSDEKDSEITKSPSSYALGKTHEDQTSDDRSIAYTCHDDLLKLKGKAGFIWMFALF